MSSIALLDYGSGNLQSVRNALEHEGARVTLLRDAADWERLGEPRAVVLPGVGAFADCADNLRARGFWEPLRQWIADDRPFLGICVGYQLLFDRSEESPGSRGLGIFRGTVRRFPRDGSGTLKIPHMGWNRLDLNTPRAPLWKSLPGHPYLFFVHSYFPEPEDRSLVTATCTYGIPFAAAIGRGNLAAVQFHPEKSQAAGLAILRNFLAQAA